MKIFGFDTSDPGGLINALKAAETNIEQLRSVVQESENRIEGIISTNLDRVGKAKLIIPQIEISLQIPGEPKATAVE
jgi:hypothetical protein